MAITLDAEDNPYRIFESLNAKGMPLTQGDLLRNYFFMRLPPAEHEHWYTSVWCPMQRRLGDRFDAFMRDFLLKEGEPVRPDEVYQEWRKRLGPLGEDDIRASRCTSWPRGRSNTTRSSTRSASSDPPSASAAVAHRLVEDPAADQFDPLLLRINADYRRGELTAEQAQQIFTGDRARSSSAARSLGARRATKTSC